MKERLTNNLGLKILSILLAFFVWLLVVNVSNPEVTRSQEVILEIENESVLLDAQRAYELSRRTVSVAYDIHTLDEYKMRPSDFRAYVDLAELYDVTGSVEVKVEILSNSNLIRNVAAKPGVVRVRTEELQSKEFKLVPNLKGRPMDGYSINGISLSPSTITIEGPMSKVGLINSVGVEINLSYPGSDVTGTAAPVFYDANGSIMSVDTKVRTDVSEIDYVVAISKLREVPLRFVVTGTPADGYRYVEYDCTVDRVSVSGTESVLLSLAELPISDPVLNVDGLDADRTVLVDLRGHMPEGVSLAEQTDPMVEVTLKVEPLATRRINLSESSILLKGMEDEWNYRVSPSRIMVTLRGLDEDLDEVSESDLEAMVDVTGLTEGSHEVSLVFAENNKYTVVEAEDVQVEVSHRPGGPGDRLHAQPERESAEGGMPEDGTGAAEVVAPVPGSSRAQEGEESMGSLEPVPEEGQDAPQQEAGP